jgi:lysophospholipase L1-like esterase
MKKRLAVYFIFLEIIVILSVGYSIIQKKFFNAKFINPIEKENINLNTGGSLNYFYEPKPGTQNVSLDWQNVNGPDKPVYKINKDTLNQIKKIDPQNKDGAFRIVTLGDSITFGENVNTEDNYPSVLQNMLNRECQGKFEVINLGVFGYDIRYVVERYRVRGQKYNPDLILWVLINDDLNRISELMIPKQQYYDEQLRQSGEYDSNIQNAGWERARSDVVSELGEDKLLKMQLDYMTILNNYYKNDLVLFMLPGEPNWSIKQKDVLTRFKETRSNIHIQELRGLSITKGEVLPDLHPSPLGHIKLANQILDYLISNNLIHCN